jgi:CRP-like cAMP-binding protein
VRLTRKTKVELLKRIPLFAECSKSELEAISRVADELTLPAGRVVMRQGARGRELVVLVDGEATVERDGATVATIRGGDFLGELALITGKPRTATVTALTDLRTLVLDGISFDRLLRDVPSVSVKVLNAVAERLPADDV